MKVCKIYAAALMAALLVLSPSVILGKDAERVGSSGESIPGGSRTVTFSPGTTSTTSTSTSSSSNTSSPYTGYSGYTIGYPSYQGTSFYNLSNYYSWSSYYSLLINSYNMNPAYFNRFYRNTEPLITPEILKLTLREPLRQSRRMLNSINQLEEMLGEISSGTASDKRALLGKSKEIREIAKQIRRNQTLATLDLRQDENLYKGNGNSSLDPEAVNRLRELAVDLDRQLRELYGAKSTATISVDSYQEHSLESLTKGIEKVCKSIEKSTRKM